MPRYFLYDPNAGIEYFDTPEACLHAAEVAITMYCIDNDGAWPTADLAAMCMGVVTHTAQQTNIVQKPRDEYLDDEGYDSDGICWTEHDYHCDYEMLPVQGLGTQINRESK